MVKIRLARIGSKNNVCYRVVVTDVRNARDGKFIERVGFFNVISIRKGDSISKDIFLDLTRIYYWIQKGAILSSRVSVLVKNYRKEFLSL